MQKQAMETIKKYYDAFNRCSMEDFFSLLTENVVHEINQGRTEQGKRAFQVFLERMYRHYQEQVVELVIFANAEGTRGAAEFFIEGSYLLTEEGFPLAKGQRYRLRCGAFFALEEGKISRVTNYYNLPEWLFQVK